MAEESGLITDALRVLIPSPTDHIRIEPGGLRARTLEPVDQICGAVHPALLDIKALDIEPKFAVGAVDQQAEPAVVSPEVQGTGGVPTHVGQLAELSGGNGGSTAEGKPVALSVK